MMSLIVGLLKSTQFSPGHPSAQHTGRRIARCKMAGMTKLVLCPVQLPGPLVVGKAGMGATSKLQMLAVCDV
jgi:hypothetical protein